MERKARSREGLAQFHEDAVCVGRENISLALKESAAAVLNGLPPWPTSSNAKLEGGAVLAFLIQVSFVDKLRLVARVFDRLYSSRDVFLYLVDEQMMDPELVRSVLPSPLPRNVHVQPSPHAGYFYWPRVQIVLDGLAGLLKLKWDFLIHLSESDYPVHSSSWLRNTLASNRQWSMMYMDPKCTTEGVRSNWYWWTEREAVASCGSRYQPTPVHGVAFPEEELEAKGFILAHSSEWMILTREVVEYATHPGLAAYRRLISMHAAADEIFWATLVLNIPNFSQGISQHQWFMHWSATSGDHSPETLTESHLPLIMLDREKYLFMRKVDEVASSTLLNEIDELSKMQEGVPTRYEWTRNAVPCGKAPLGPFGWPQQPAPAPPPPARHILPAPAPPAESAWE